MFNCPALPGLEATVKDPILIFFDRASSGWCSVTMLLKLATLLFFVLILNTSWAVPFLGHGDGGDCYKVPAWLQRACADNELSVTAYTRCVREAPVYVSGSCNFAAAMNSHNELSTLHESVVYALLGASILALVVGLLLRNLS